MSNIRHMAAVKEDGGAGGGEGVRVLGMRVGGGVLSCGFWGCSLDRSGMEAYEDSFDLAEIVGILCSSSILCALPVLSFLVNCLSSSG